MPRVDSTGKVTATGRVTIPSSLTGSVLLETGDVLLLETGDKLLLDLTGDSLIRPVNTGRV